MANPAVRVYKTGAVFGPNPITPYPPAPRKGEVLIRNVCVSSNPKDWKLSSTGAWDEGHIEGNDVAGYIETVGSDVEDFKPGDKVAGFSRMAYHDRAGAYQAYTVVPAWTTFPLGPRTSFEDAATVPLAAMTACLGLFVRLKVPEPNPDGSPNPANNGKGIMVWGASSSVGAFAVQLARLAGLYVIGIAGAGAKLAKEMGCDVVVDYRAPDVGTKLRAAVAVSGRTFIHAYDAHSGRSGATSSYEELGAAMQPNGGAICIVRSKEAVNRTIAMPKEELEKIPKNVEVYPSMVGTAHYWDRDGPFAKRWFRQMGRWLEEGKFKPNVVRIIPGGLAGVSEGLKLLEENKISGEKLVYRIADTPPLTKL